MVQQPIAVIRDVPLVGHGQDGNTKNMTASWEGVAAKMVVAEIASTDSEGLVRLLVENDKWWAAFRD